MTQLLQKHWESQEDRGKHVWHDSEERPSMDIMTAFDVAGPKRIAKIVGGQNVHEWITAALGFWDGRTKTDARSGCGVVIKGVDQDKWITINKIALP